MNEELQKELLSILKAMKDGAPGAWQELVSQRSTYCFTIAFTLLFMTLISILTLWKSLKATKLALQAPKENYRERSWDQHTQVFSKNTIFELTISLVLAAISAIVILVCLANIWYWIAEGVAPLGPMLGALR